MRRFLPALLALLLAFASGAGAGVIVDLRGRTVTVPDQVHRLTIDDGRYLLALALLHNDPAQVIAGWPKDVHRIGQKTYDLLVEKFPALPALRQVASSAGNFDVESILAAAPDVAVLSLGSAASDAQVAQIQAAGIPVVFIDFFNNPFKNQSPSLKILGQLTGKTPEAGDFIAFRERRLQLISQRVARLAPAERPSVFLEAHAGITNDCCNSPGRGNVGDYIEFVGGHNIGADVLKGASGKLSLEYVISRDPQIYIATGGAHLEKSGGLVLGPGYTEDRARASLAKVAARRGIAQLTAVTKRNVHGLSHQLINSPIDIVAVEVLAKWIHPALFQDVAPEKTLAEINRRFLPVGYGGANWIDLQ